MGCSSSAESCEVQKPESMRGAVKPRSADKPAMQPPAERVHHPAAPPLRAPTARAGSGAGGGSDGAGTPKLAASAHPMPPAHPQQQQPPEHLQRQAAVEPAPVSSCSWRELSARDEELELSDLRRHVPLPLDWQPPQRAHAPQPSPPTHEQAVVQAGVRPVSVVAASSAGAADAADAAEAALQLKVERAQRAQKTPTTPLGAEVLARAQPPQPAAVLLSGAASQLEPPAQPAPVEAPLVGGARDVTSGGGHAAWPMEKYALQDALEDARGGGATPADGSVSTVGTDDTHEEPCDAAAEEVDAIVGVADSALARGRVPRPSTAPLQSYDMRGAGGEVRLAVRRAHARMSHPALPVCAPLSDSHAQVALAAVAALKCRQEEKRARGRAGRDSPAEGASPPLAAAPAAAAAQRLAAPPLGAPSLPPPSQPTAPPVVDSVPAPAPVAAAPAATAPVAAIAPPIALPQIGMAPTSSTGNASAARAKLSALRRSRDYTPQSIVAPTAALIPVPSAPSPPPMLPVASSPPTRGFSRVSDCTPLMASVAWPSGQLAAAAATPSAAAVPPAMVPPAWVSPARPGSGSGSRSEALARLRRSAGNGSLAQQLQPAPAPVPSLPPSLPSLISLPPAPPAPLSGQALCRSATEVEMVFRLGALASERDVADAAAAARRLRAMLAAVASTARIVATEPQHVFAYLVRHMHALTPASSSAASSSASWAGPSGLVVSPIRAAQAAPPSWAAVDAALGGRAAEYGAAVAELRRLVRIKVQDNNDLALATRCVSDACAFFDALHAHAQLVGKPPAAALAELRTL